MQKKQKIQLTTAGLEKLKHELDERRNVRRKEINKILQAAIEQGDISENDQYNLALEDAMANNERIKELMDIIKNAEVSEYCGNVKKVCIGHKVTLKDKKDKELVVTIVGETEGNPLEKKISSNSPMGSALLGEKVNSTVQIKAPNGGLEYTIVKIEKA